MATGFERILARVRQNERCLVTVVLQCYDANLINSNNTHHAQVQHGDSLMKMTCECYCYSWHSLQELKVALGAVLSLKIGRN